MDHRIALTSTSAVAFNVSKRKSQDLGFGALYLLLLLATLGFAAYGASKADLNNLRDAGCGLFAPPSPPAIGASPPSPPTVDFSGDLKIIAESWYYTVGMVLLLMAIGAGWLAALCRHAVPVVYVTVAMIPLSWFSGAATAAQLGSAPSAAVFGACGLLSLLWLRCIRRKLELTAALIQEATHVLSSHPSLVAAALSILLGLLGLCALLGTSIVLLIATGSWQLEGGLGGGGASCVLVLPSASRAGIALSAAALLWSTMLAFTLRYFTVSFVTACWYFSPGDNLALGASSEGSDEIERGPGEVHGQVPPSPTRHGLALGLSTSFGTLCYAALVLSVCELINAIARKSMRSRNLLVVVAGCCLRCFVALIEFLNKFAVSHHAVSAAPFCTSARQISTILARNALSAYVVDRIGGFVLHFGAFVLSGLVAGLTTALVASTLPTTLEQDEEEADLTAAPQRALLLGSYMGLSFAVAFPTLNFLATLMINVVDAAYTCHALDLEGGVVHRPRMHAALLAVAKPATAVVQQPGGVAPAIAVPVEPAPPAPPVGYAVGVPASPA